MSSEVIFCFIIPEVFFYHQTRWLRRGARSFERWGNMLNFGFLAARGTYVLVIIHISKVVQFERSMRRCAAALTFPHRRLEFDLHTRVRHLHSEIANSSQSSVQFGPSL